MFFSFEKKVPKYLLKEEKAHSYLPLGRYRSAPLVPMGYSS
jgi:hypothetical protein